MKITELKEIYEAKANNIRKDLSYFNKITITSVYTIPYEDGKIKLKVTSKSEDNGWRNMHISISLDGYIARTYYTPPNDIEELSYLKEQLKCAMEYWRKYADIKGYKATLFHAENGINIEMKNILIEVLSEGLKGEHFDLLTVYFQRMKRTFIGGALSEDYILHMDNFYLTKQTLEEVIKNNSLIAFSEGSVLFDLFGSSILFHYCGEEIRVWENNSFNTLTFDFYYSKRFEESEYEVTMDYDSITSFFNKIKEHLKLVNVMNPPMDNFKKMIKHLFYDINEEKITNIFNDLQNKFGSWEEVEQESNILYSNLMDKDDRDDFLITELKDGQNREMFVYKFKTDNRFFHFISQRDIKDNDNWKNYFVICSEEEYPKEVNEVTIEYFIPSYK